MNFLVPRNSYRFSEKSCFHGLLWGSPILGLMGRPLLVPTRGVGWVLQCWSFGLASELWMAWAWRWPRLGWAWLGLAGVQSFFCIVWASLAYWLACWLAHWRWLDSRMRKHFVTFCNLPNASIRYDSLYCQNCQNCKVQIPDTRQPGSLRTSTICSTGFPGRARRRSGV